MSGKETSHYPDPIGDKIADPEYRRRRSEALLAYAKWWSSMEMSGQADLAKGMTLYLREQGLL